MQNDLPPDIQSPKPLDKRLQLVLVIVCILVLALGGLGVWYTQFRTVYVMFHVKNYVVPAKATEPVLSSRSNRLTTNPPTSAFRQLELTDEEARQFLSRMNGAEELGSTYTTVVHRYPVGMTWHARHKFGNANLEGKFEARLANGSEMLRITFDADLTKADPNESMEDFRKRQKGGARGSSSTMKKAFRVDAFYDGPVPIGSLLFIKKIDDKSYQVIVFDPT